jgi:hypothetical protein
VGGSHNESAQEIEKNNEKGKANAMRIGVKQMGKRLNVVMTIQVPIEQEITAMYAGDVMYDDQPKYMSLGQAYDDVESKFTSLGADTSYMGTNEAVYRGSFSGQNRCLSEGVSNAARINTGMHKGTAKQLVVCNPRRNKDQNITVTAIFYYSVSGGVPGIESVKSAILDMEEMFAKWNWSGKLDGSDDLSDPKAWSEGLASAGASFMWQSKAVKKSVDPNQGFPL